MKIPSRTILLIAVASAISCSNNYKNIEVREGSLWKARGEWTNFTLKGEALTENGSEAALLFHSDGSSGYEVLLHNGPIDGSRKTGSLSAIRNLYRSLAEDDEVYEYLNEVKDLPFLRGVQGEGRRWTVTFSQGSVWCY